MYKILQSTTLVLCTAMILLLEGCGGRSEPSITTCKANPESILGYGTAALSVQASVKKEYSPLTFMWQQLKPQTPLGKIASPTSFKTEFRAPVLDKNTTFKIQVKATNTKSESSTCDVEIQVMKERVKTWTDIGELFSNPKTNKK